MSFISSLFADGSLWQTQIEGGPKEMASFSGLTDTLQQVYRQQGLRGLYRGAWARGPFYSIAAWLDKEMNATVFVLQFCSTHPAPRWWWLSTTSAEPFGQLFSES